MTTRISAKNLAALNMEDACPRCFWIKNKCKIPYSIFPGIFSTLDKYSKEIVQAWFEKTGGMPPWLPQLMNTTAILKAPHWKKFQRLDPVTGITLSGTPDLYLETATGAHIIPDLKTAKITENADRLRPLYVGQLNGYRWIDEGFGFTVLSTPLIYCEPVALADTIGVDSVLTSIGFMMGFKTQQVEIEHDPHLIHRLLAKAKDILDMWSPPAGADNCKDCDALDTILCACETNPAAESQAA